MKTPTPASRRSSRWLAFPGAALMVLSACASGSAPGAASVADLALRTAPDPDPRVGLEPGLFDAGEALWNLRRVSSTPPPREFVGQWNTDLAFKDDYAIQGNYDGIIVWDISDPSAPTVVRGYLCPASQSDVSVYGDLLFVSGEGLGGRLDCGAQGVDESVSHDRLRGIRIFDISDIANPRYIHNVQTCRGSHTHTLVKDPDDDDNVYIYVSGSSTVRPAEELPGCSGAPLDEDPSSALFRIEVIRVPLAAPEQAAIASSPRIFSGLTGVARHGAAPEELAEAERARAAGAFIIDVPGNPRVVSDREANQLLAQIVAARRGTGAPTAADSAVARELYARETQARITAAAEPGMGPTQCHDITVFPAVGLAGGACGGYGLLIDISDPVNPVRLDAASDENFSLWHSATFNNDGTKILFSDEWGGGTQPKCRESDPREWGADAIFTIEDGRRMRFHSYYKLSAPQTSSENCVAHNGSLIPIPGRDVMAQAWYQGGVSVFDWTDPDRVVEIAFHDRGPMGGTGRSSTGGSWSIYWFNGLLVSSEIGRGLDIFELTTSPMLTENELDAAKTARLADFNAQGQPRFEWPESFALARAYVDQLERSAGLSASSIAAVREGLTGAERASVAARRATLQGLATEVGAAAEGSADAAKVRALEATLRALSGAE